MKIVVQLWNGNDGFALSKPVVEWMAEHGSEEARALLEKEAARTPEQNYFRADKHSFWWDDRQDPLLIEAVETLGDKAIGLYDGPLAVIEIPDGIEYEIGVTPDGDECVEEKHRVWMV